MPIDLASFGASGAVVVVVVIFLKFIREAEDKRDETYRLVAKSLETNTKATISADKYLKERNGRDAKAAELLAQAVEKSADTLAKTVKNQHKALMVAVGAIPAQIIKTANTTAKTLKENKE